MSANNLKTHKTFEGLTQFWEHDSTETKTKMKFSTFIPSGVVKGCLVWLSGLTCTDENFITKAGAQKFLAEAGLMVICPDTSPRGLNLPHEHDSYDFGSGASFYVNATTDGYKDHYRMYSYIAEELHTLVQKQFGIPANKISIMGHSMGGHGALVIGLREGKKFRSVSAFSPIVNPNKPPWGVKSQTGYFWGDKTDWEKKEACALVKSGMTHAMPIMIDQGTQDEFLEKQLLTDNFVKVCQDSGQTLQLHFREGYDHSYYFISTFIKNHILFHAQALG
jgi:S-formylglutathione hydrolase